MKETPHTRPISMIPSSSLQGREADYKGIVVSVPRVLSSWRHSLFAFEWLDPKGALKTKDSLPEAEREKRNSVEKAIEEGAPLECPVLGIGLLDTVEIGAGRAVFLTLAAHGFTEVEVHVPEKSFRFFKDFLASTP